MDLKSVTLALLMEQMGLADPIRYTWTLHDRSVGANCPVGNEYLVTKRNLRLCLRTWISSSIPATSTACSISYYIREYCSDPHPGLASVRSGGNPG